MKYYRFSLETIFVGSEDYEIVEFDDNATFEEISETYTQWVMEQNQGTFYECDEDGNEKEETE